VSDNVLIAAHFACDQGDLEAAEQLLAIAEFMLLRAPRGASPSGGAIRRNSSRRMNGCGLCVILKRVTIEGGHHPMLDPQPLRSGDTARRYRTTAGAFIARNQFDVCRAGDRLQLCRHASIDWFGATAGMIVASISSSASGHNGSNGGGNTGPRSKSCGGDRRQTVDLGREAMNETVQLPEAGESFTSDEIDKLKNLASNQTMVD
jgi:hypothetical protein